MKTTSSDIQNYISSCLWQIEIADTEKSPFENGAKEQLDKITTTLKKNKRVFHYESLMRFAKSIFVVVGTIYFGYLLGNGFLVASSDLERILKISFVLVFAALILLSVRRTTKPKLPGYILLVSEIINHGFNISRSESYPLEPIWNNICPFLNRGDFSDDVTLSIRGEFDGIEFHYFNYEYSIESEKEVEVYDFEGNFEGYETEYDEKVFQESCIAFSLKSNIGSLYTTDSKEGALEISYIELNKRMLFRAYSDIKAYTFLTPKTQVVLAELVRKLPYIKLSFSRYGLIVHFDYEYIPVSKEEVEVDMHLLRILKEDNGHARRLENMLPKFKDILHQMREYRG